MQNDPYLPNKYPAKYFFVICSWPGAMFKLVQPTYPPKGGMPGTTAQPILWKNLRKYDRE